MARVPGDRKLEVWQRDNWTCHYCQCTVEASQVPHPQMATVDHIRPRSAGGVNAKINLVTACYQCNQEKADHLAWTGPSRARCRTRLTGEHSHV